MLLVTCVEGVSRVSCLAYLRGRSVPKPRRHLFFFFDCGCGGIVDCVVVAVGFVLDFVFFFVPVCVICW